MTKSLPMLLFAVASLVLTLSSPARAADQPTVVLVHGAFADGSGWDGVAARLRADHYPVIVAANDLRSLSGDAAAVAALLKTVKGPIVLVGHSYGGSVISNAGGTDPDVKALVFVDAFAPEAGETALALTGKFPGSALGPAILPAPLATGGVDLYIQPAQFAAVFAADVKPELAAAMAAGQRPATQAALTEPSGPPAWKTLPSWFIYGDADLCIPPAAHAFMAQRAGSKKTVIVPGGPHAVMVSHPDAVAELIETAAQSVMAAPAH